MQTIYEKSPTRVDLAGGTLDCWPLYLFLANPVTINVAIDVFTHCELTPRSDQTIILNSKDLNREARFADLKAFLADQDPDFALFRSIINYFKPEMGFELRTRSESPVGGGLGGSSSLCISILKAFTKWLERPMSSADLVRLASHLEAQVLVKPTGTQDYFPPLFGGMCFIEYTAAGPQAEVQPIPEDVFQDRFLLVYTGKSHHSGINNWSVIKNYLDGDPNTQACLQELARVSKKMELAIREKRWSDLPEIFSDEYSARTRLCEGFSSPEIRQLEKLARDEQAWLKICGAGGGGCVMIWCPQGQAERVRQKVAEAGFHVLNARPWQEPQIS